MDRKAWFWVAVVVGALALEPAYYMYRTRQINAQLVYVTDAARFDAGVLNGLVDGAWISDAKRAELRAAVAGAAQNASLIPATQAGVKQALGW
jgi:hypothetical protein